MRFVGKTAFEVSCSNSCGGVELVQGRSTGAAVPAPLVRIHKDGTFAGAVTHTWKPVIGPAETDHLTINGHFTGPNADGQITFNQCLPNAFHLAAK